MIKVATCYISDARKHTVSYHDQCLIQQTSLRAVNYRTDADHKSKIWQTPKQEIPGEAHEKRTIKCVKHGGLLRSSRCCSLYTANSSAAKHPQQHL